MRRSVRTTTVGQTSLFSADDPLRLFLSIPSGLDLTRETDAVMDAGSGAARRARIDLEWVRGTDAPSDDQTRRRAWIRQQLEGHIDGVVEFYAPSCGLGREDAIAAGQHLPRLLAIQGRETISPALGADDTGRIDHGRYASIRELRQLAADWFATALPALSDAHDRRKRKLATVPSLRQRCLRAWEALGEPQQRALAQLVNTTQRTLGGWLADDACFSALDHGEALLIAQELGQWDALSGHTPRALPAVVLTPKQLGHFHAAKDALRLTVEQADRLLLAGLGLHADRQALEATGAIAFKDRRSVNSRSGWIRIWRDVCGALES